MLAAIIRVGLGTFLSLLLGVVSIKILALFTGTIGVGVYSILRQLQQTGSIIGSLGGQTALIQGLASRNEKTRAPFILVAIISFVFTTCLVVVVLFLSAQPLSTWLFHELNSVKLTSFDKNQLILWCAVPIGLGVLVFFFQGLLNGYRNLSGLAWVQVAGAFGLAATAYPVALLVREGHYIAIVLMLGTGSLCSLLVGWFISKRYNWLRPVFATPFLWDETRDFWKLAFTTLLANVVNLVTLLVLRGIIVQRFGLHQAGIFDVCWTISTTYVMLVLSSIGTYYLPTLSAETDLQKRQMLIAQMLKFVTAISVPLIVSVIVLKAYLVTAMYSLDFLESLKIMRWMLIGDFLKIASWVLAIPMLAQADSKQYLFGEMLWCGSFLGFTLFVNSYESVGIGFLFAYGCYLLYVLIYNIQKKNWKYNFTEFAVWLLGASVILISSIVNWQKNYIELYQMVFLIGISFIYCGLIYISNLKNWYLKWRLR